jgi:hypothetical protein
MWRVDFRVKDAFFQGVTSPDAGSDHRFPLPTPPQCAYVLRGSHAIVTGTCRAGGSGHPGAFDPDAQETPNASVHAAALAPPPVVRTNLRTRLVTAKTIASSQFLLRSGAAAGHRSTPASPAKKKPSSTRIPAAALPPF